MENDLEKKIEVLRSDNRRKYSNKVFSAFLKTSGIKHQTSIPYSPEKNGLAERMNRSLVEFIIDRVKCTRCLKNLKKTYWAELMLLIGHHQEF